MTRQLAYVLFAATICTPAVPASADPIDLVYRVNVFQRLDFTRPVSDWRWDAITPVSFGLSVRFDAGVLSERASVQPDGRYLFTYFGAPDVSDVPLSGAGYTGGRHIAETRLLNATIGGTLHQEALTVDQFSDDRGSRSLQLLKFPLDSQIPAGQFGTLADFLNAMRSPTLSFYFADLAYGHDPQGNITYLPGSADYFGNVSLLNGQPSPVPEPATMTLVALGIGAMLRARRRTKAVRG